MESLRESGDTAADKLEALLASGSHFPTGKVQDKHMHGGRDDCSHGGGEDIRQEPHDQDSGMSHGNVDQPVPTGEMNPSGISSNRGDLIQELAAKAWEGLAAQKEGDEMTADVQLPEAATTLSAGGGKGQGATQSHMPAAPSTEL